MEVVWIDEPGRVPVAEHGCSETSLCPGWFSARVG